MLKLGKHRGVYVLIEYTSGRRTRRSLGTTDKAEADRILASVSAAAPRSPYTVGDIFNRYLLDKQKKGKPTERIAYAFKALSGGFASLLPDEVTDDRVHDWTTYRMRSAASGTIHVELSYLRAALRWAAGKKLIPMPISIQLPSKPRPKTDYIPKPVFVNLLKKTETPHVRLFLTLAVSTGGRVASLLDLTWDRVDLTKRTINLDNPDRSKTSKGRATVPINDTLFKALVTAKKGALSPYVIEWGGLPIKSIKTAFKLLSKRTGLKVTPHMLRHSAAVWMAEGGIPMSEISQYLGHTNTAVTERVYARFSPEYLRKAASVLDF